MEIINELIKTTKDSEKREFYKDKHGNLEFSLSTIMGNIECNIMTEAKYLSNIKKYLQEQEALATSLAKKLGKSNEHVKRVLKRIELLKTEIKDGENPQQEQAPEDHPMAEPGQPSDPQNT